MKIHSPQTLDAIRSRMACEYCKRPCLPEVHHIFTRGAGRLDVRPNLIALCRECHADFHAGNLLRCDLLLIVAHREGELQDHIRDLIHLLRRLPKAPRPWEVEREVAGCGAELPLVSRVLREHGLMFEE